ncbi:hypothetical protein J6590_048199 [Homalodisca vitripennis]|nr:hypothetical protein J6590_048199 [Homalodisca vitripennis]
MKSDVTDFVESEVEYVAGTSRTRLGDADLDLDEGNSDIDNDFEDVNGCTNFSSRSGEEYEPYYSDLVSSETDINRRETGHRFHP